MKHLDESDARFLQAVVTYGGTDVTTTSIRRETGFSPEKTRYRFQKLEDMGHISVDYATESTGPGDPPRTATLTAQGRQAFNSLDVHDQTEPTTREEYEERLMELERQVRLLVDAVDRLERFMEAWREHLPFIDNVCTAVVRKIPEVKEETRRVAEEHQSEVDEK